MMRRTMRAIVMAVAVTGTLLAGDVQQNTVNRPDSVTFHAGGTWYMPGAWVGVEGPGAVASTTMDSECYAWKGHMARTMAGSQEVRLDHPAATSSQTAVISINVAGFTWTRVRLTTTEALGVEVWGNGTITCQTTVAYSTLIRKDGISEILPPGAGNGQWVSEMSAGVVAGAPGEDDKEEPFFKSYNTLVSFRSSASIHTGVSSTSCITAVPAACGTANGQIAAYVASIEF